MKKASFCSTSFVFLCAAIFASVSSAQDTNFPPVPSTPTVAHRGFSFVAPENTVSSALKAIEIGADGCESDIYSTTDGVLYVLHDGNLKRTTGFDRPATQVSFAELSTLDFGAWKGDAFKGEKVTTYDEELALLKFSGCRPIVEVKENGFEDKIVAGLRRFDMIGEAIVIDFSATRVKKIRELEPNLCVAWLCSFKDVSKETPQSMATKIIETLKDCNTNVVDVQSNAVSPEFLKILKDAGVYVMCWTVDDPAELDRLIGWGVESITTNRPDLAIEARKKFEASQKAK